MLTPWDDGDDAVHRFRTRNNDRTVVVEVVEQTDPAAVAADAMEWVRANHFVLKGVAAAALLDDYNEEWAEADEGREDTETALGAADFGARLNLRRLTVLPDRSLRVAYDDGGMFSGHLVVVVVDERRAPVRAVLEG